MVRKSNVRTAEVKRRKDKYLDSRAARLGVYLPPAAPDIFVEANSNEKPEVSYSYLDNRDKKSRKHLLPAFL